MRAVWCLLALAAAVCATSPNVYEKGEREYYSILDAMGSRTHPDDIPEATRALAREYLAEQLHRSGATPEEYQRAVAKATATIAAQYDAANKEEFASVWRSTQIADALEPLRKFGLNGLVEWIKRKFEFLTNAERQRPPPTNPPAARSV